MVYSLAADERGERLVSASEDGTVRIWNVDQGKEERTLRMHQSPVYGVDVSYRDVGERINELQMRQKSQKKKKGK